MSLRTAASAEQEASALPSATGPSAGVETGPEPEGRARPARTFWWESRRSMLFDVLVALAFTTAAATLVSLNGKHPFGVTAPVFYTVLLLSSPAMIWRRRLPASLCAVAILATPVLINASPLPVYLYSVAKYGRGRRSTAVLTAAAALVTAGTEFFSGGNLFAVLPLVLVGVAGPVLLGLYARARRTLLENLQERTGRLEREQSLLRRQTRMEERNRIAREMHDVVAHRVSLMVIHSGALQVAPTSSPEAVRTSGLIGEIGRQALDELHQVLGVLRLEEPEESAPRTPNPTLKDLSGLVEQSRATGMTVELTRSGDRPALGGAAERTLYRLVQEALTNVHKHAGAPVTRVRLRYEADAVHVTVENEPPAGVAADPLPGGGSGLLGLRERVVVLGGEFEAGPRPDGGFRVSAVVPVQAVVPPPRKEAP
ncbi:signal transduction histidine kinase [Streptomyces sp. Amel2xB2]|uniref:sensor histidine kinase n=1 Tax=Streptomyces sp. Amel2xB2 TaxID=1305829 RepID=UPI000DBA8AD2|nr:histidine kinase [Streptomyces sp. Amel2xB2]RAJ70386.1 signal transduction histidine kinase [Streptomyces sp. Amel2xB2]